MVYQDEYINIESDTFFLKNTVNISKRYKIFLKVQQKF